MISHSNIHNTRCAPDGLPLIVPRDMMGIWLYADTTMDPTKEEAAMYEFHLQLQVRPPPILNQDLLITNSSPPSLQDILPCDQRNKTLQNYPQWTKFQNKATH